MKFEVWERRISIVGGAENVFLASNSALTTEPELLLRGWSRDLLRPRHRLTRKSAVGGIAGIPAPAGTFRF